MFMRCLEFVFHPVRYTGDMGVDEVSQSAKSQDALVPV